MHLSVLLLLSLSRLVVADPFALPPGFDRFAPRNQGIKWEPCEKDSNSTKVCGRFEVPLDYANEAAGKASLAVARYPASNQPKLGTLFLNPGGPGISGVELVTGDNAVTLMNVVGGKYDLVSWDPRGVGLTYPRAECFATAKEEKAFWNGTMIDVDVGIEARGTFTDPADLRAFYAQVPEVDTLLRDFGEKCLKYSPGTFQYMGTTAVVRDMVALHDYLEGADKPINYWGFSYGTLIGVYFANMFPKRVGRVAIDGVVDPIYWANRPPHEFWGIAIESADEVLTGFVQACAAAGPGNCAIASAGSTADSLREWIQQLLDMAYDYKKAAGVDARFGSAQIRELLLFEGLNTPNRWPKLAKDLMERWEVLHNNSTPTSQPLRKRLERPLTPIQIANVQARQNPQNVSDVAEGYALQAITCADAVDPGNVTTKMVFDELVKAFVIVGPSRRDGGLYCHRWPVRAVERFTGPWNSTLSNPILVIGNKADPITPFRAAKVVADALGGSATLVEQDGYGHTSLAMRSNCTLKILENYFLNNQLPSTDQFCGASTFKSNYILGTHPTCSQTNQVLFPGPGATNSSNGGPATGKGNSKSAATNLQSQLHDTQSRARRFVGAIIALACAISLL
ncbi:hypothetical protein FRC06_011854 [Ceratobasidium sp. 370]|nr:hypothetical protein FRC06_011854 [Ceratobasidium sp. 370]